MDVGARVSEDEATARFLAEPGEESFRALYRALAPRIVRYFRARGCDLALAEDLTQEVMLAVFRQSRALRDRNLFRPWLYKVARNALLQHLRRNGRQVATTELEAGLRVADPASGDPVWDSRFGDWMKWLEPDERQIMMLRYLDELEYREIAALLGMPLGTVQWKIFHAKGKLAERFGVRPV